MKEQNKKNYLIMKDWFLREKKETEILLRCIPATTVSLFVVSVICMNLLANKTLLQTPYIALDGGILISWLSFMCMDIITKYFGPKASTKIAILASAINVLTCAIFYIASIIPSNANDYTALDELLGGTWFILLGSTIAFLASAITSPGKNPRLPKKRAKVFFFITASVSLNLSTLIITSKVKKYSNNHIQFR